MAKTYEKAYSAAGDRLFAADEFAAAKAKLLMFRILSIDADGEEQPTAACGSMFTRAAPQ